MLALRWLDHWALGLGWAERVHVWDDPRLAVRVMGLTFPTPLGIAGGFDKNAVCPRALASLGFGFLELGTVTRERQAPNPPPNLFRLPLDRALINRLGFPNDGAETVGARARAYRTERDAGRVRYVPIGMSIGKSRSVDASDMAAVVRDYVESFRAVRAAADFVVVNVSSPNTAQLRALQGADHARTLLQALMEENDRGVALPPLPLLLKVAPDLEDDGLDALVGVVRECKLAGIVATNTTLRRTGLRTAAGIVARMGAGGLSGPPLAERAVEVVRRVRRGLGPEPVVIGVGGIETAADALRMLEAGANLLQLYTGFVYQGPTTARDIHRGLSAYVDTLGLGTIADCPKR
jgi:dihydroorotate dehydrogenase